MKTCTTCGQTKELSCFNKSKRGYLGYKSECRECQSIYRKAHYERNAEKARQQRIDSYNNNKEKEAAYRKKYNQSTRGKALKCALQQKRKTEQKKRIPLWSDLERIKSYYNVCAFFNEVNGYTKYHVDHIIPLQGKLVSGLHVHNNLQVILAKDNMSKNNKFTVSGY